MIEKYGLFDSLEGDEREYAEVDFARFGRVLGLEGVRGGAEALRVSAAASGLAVNIAPGLAMVQGRYYELEDDGSGAFTLNLSAAVSHPRIDRIVLTLDFASRTVKLGVLAGSEAASPAPPALTRSAAKYMLSLAQVRVAVGAGALTQENITDERGDESVCGLFVASADAALAAAQAAGKAADDAKAAASAAQKKADQGAEAAASAKAAADAAQKTADGKAGMGMYSAVLVADGWSESAPYTQTVHVPGVTQKGAAIADLNMAGAGVVGGAQSAVLTGVRVTENNLSHLYRCQITGEDGNVLYTPEVGAGDAPEGHMQIIRQPQYANAQVGDVVSFHVEAVGVAKYQGQFFNPGLSDPKWATTSAEGNTTDTMVNYEYLETRAAYLFRCRLTGEDGSVIYTNAVGLGARPDGTLEIVRNPVYAEAQAGDSASFAVEANDAAAYQWQASTDGGSKWSGIEATVDAVELQAAWGLVGRLETRDDALTAYCYEDVPALDLPVNILMVR